MTPFAQLDPSFCTAGKAAGAGGMLWKGVKSLYNNGVWGTASKLAERGVAQKGAVGSLARGTKSVADHMNGPIGTGLGLYGMAGMTAPLTGIDLPGSSLAMNVGMPGIGAAYTAGSLINTARLGSKKNQLAIRRDAEEGARSAGADFISGVDMDPGVTQGAGQYRKFMTDHGVDFKGADTYRDNAYARPMGKWKMLQSAFENPQDIVNHRVRSAIQDQLSKHAGIGSVLGKVWNGAGHVMKPLMVGGAAVGLGDAILSDKPYDAEAVQAEGRSGAQAGIQKRLDAMTPMERFGARLDPSLAAQAAEKRIPGSIAAWEKQTGQKFQPGLIASTMEAWRTGGKPKFYSTDAAGNRRYIG